MYRRLQQFLALVGALLVTGVVASVPAIAATGTVTISDNAFTPQQVTIKVGDKVKWSYPTGTVSHTATARSGQGVSFDSGSMVMGDTYTSPAFTKAGTFIYYCKIHGAASGAYNNCAMCGKVIVKSAATPPPEITPIRTPTPKPKPRTPAPTVRQTTAPLPVIAPPSDSPTPSPTPTPTATPKPTPTVELPTFSPESTAIAFGTPDSSNRGPLLGIGIAAVGIAIGGGILIWYRLRGPA